jgi:hypothetical protein
MKRVYGMFFVLIFVPMIATAMTPMEYLQKCFSCMGQTESSVLQNGAVLNSEVDCVNLA